MFWYVLIFSTAFFWDDDPPFFGGMAMKWLSRSPSWCSRTGLWPRKRSVVIDGYLVGRPAYIIIYLYYYYIYIISVSRTPATLLRPMTICKMVVQQAEIAAIRLGHYIHELTMKTIVFIHSWRCTLPMTSPINVAHGTMWEQNMMMEFLWSPALVLCQLGHLPKTSCAHQKQWHSPLKSAFTMLMRMRSETTSAMPPRIKLRCIHNNAISLTTTWDQLKTAFEMSFSLEDHLMHMPMRLHINQTLCKN